jgi:hypothetical protein
MPEREYCPFLTFQLLSEFSELERELEEPVSNDLRSAGRPRRQLCLAFCGSLTFRKCRLCPLLLFEVISALS